MTYISGTITSSDPGPALYTDVATALTAAGFTLEDTVTISTRTHKIWKSAAANNTEGKDWYVDVAYPTNGAGRMSFFPMEGYNATTDSAIRRVVANADNTIEGTYFSRWGAVEKTLEHADLSVHPGNVVTLGIGLSTTSFGYWMSITGDRILAIGSSQPQQVMYSGFYETVDPHKTFAGATTYPLAYAMIATNGTASGTDYYSGIEQTTLMLTRLPKLTNLGTRYGWQSVPRVNPAYAQWSYYPAIPSGGLEVLGGRYATPLILEFYGGSGGVNTGLVGYMRDVLLIPGAATVVRGDTVTIDGVNWVCSTVNTGVVLMKAA